jgi:hypothetical protein
MIEIYFDEEEEVLWFIGLHQSLPRANRKKILERGSNPAYIERLIDYDRPDIIVVADGKVVLVIEKTREVPTGHNVGQRMARLVRAVERGVPTIVFFPFDARKYGKYSGICNLNVRILDAFEKMWNIHNTPIVAINWISNEFGELVGDGSEDQSIRSLVSGYFDNKFDVGSSRFMVAREMNQTEYARRVNKRRSYQKPPPSVEVIQTSEFCLRHFSVIPHNISQQLAVRRETIVYEIKMTEAKCRREDPYTGMQFIYDYTYCRIGPRASEKKRNLVLSFPLVRRDYFADKNPNDTLRKSCNWYLTANLLLFRDGVIFLR